MQAQILVLNNMPFWAVGNTTLVKMVHWPVYVSQRSARFGFMSSVSTSDKIVHAADKAMMATSHHIKSDCRFLFFLKNSKKPSCPINEPANAHMPKMAPVTGSMRPSCQNWNIVLDDVKTIMKLDVDIATNGEIPIRIIIGLFTKPPDMPL